jgi:hypothetical protein
MNYIALGFAVIAAFVISAVYYGTLGGRLAALKPEAYAGTPSSPLRTVLVELVRNLVLATVVAGLANEIGVDGWTGGMVLGLVLWVGFPLVLWSGAVFHEKEPWRLALIHAGDWLLKLVAVATIVGAG